MCNTLILFFHKLNGITAITSKIVKTIIWPWLLTLMWPWPWVWPLTLTIWRNKIFFKMCKFCEVMWRKSVTSYVKTETTYRMCPSIRNILQPTRNMYNFRFQCYGWKGDFYGSQYIWPWPWHFKVICFLRIHHLFQCMTGVNLEAICS